MSQDYNGWIGFGTRDSAWATWNMNLWIDSQYSIYKEKIAFIRYRKNRNALTADAVKHFCLEFFPKGTPDFESVKELKLVNWEEILEHWEEE